jgi:hypothetical protein
MNDSALHLPPLEQTDIRLKEPAATNWWRIADFGVLGLWLAITGFTLSYHEKWADEAQAWLIARDLSLWRIFSYELRYEGSPGLWHLILWIAQHIFRAPYAALGPIGLAFATAGVAFLIFFAPFPRPLRWLLAFSYFMVYQYAVIARPYTLLPLLCFLAAYFFRDLKHPERMTIVLVLLANLTLHGTIIAGCLGLVYLLDAIPAWPTFDEQLRRRYWLCIGAMALAFLFVIAILIPTKDVEIFVPKSQLAPIPGPKPTLIQKIFAILSGAFFDHPLPSFIFLALAGGWFYLRKRLTVLTLPVVALIALYAGIHGTSHHHGTLFVATVAAFWIAWPTSEEQAQFSRFDRTATQLMAVLLMVLALFNIWDAAFTIRNDYRYPYCGAQDVVQFLKSVGAGREPIFGYMYGMAAVQAYYDRNILANTPTTYAHHGLPLVADNVDEQQLRELSPEYIILFCEDPNFMHKRINDYLVSKGYVETHFSDGYILYKRISYGRQSYLIYKRTTP